MKKTILLLTISLACICTHAQKLDKKLLIGRWNLYAMGMAGRSLCRDSVPETVQAMIRARKMDDSSLQMTAADSIALIDAAKAKLADMFKTFITFDENGKTKVMMGFDKDENGEFTEETGTYEWSGDDKVTQNLGKTKPDVFIIMSLTATRLVIKPEDTDDNSGMSMTFTRAK
jgi:hypothetical protein